MSSNHKPNSTQIDLEGGKKAHVSETIYMHSEELMALVRELYEHWRDDPVSEKYNPQAQTMWFYSGLLASAPAAYIEIHNLAFGTSYAFDSDAESELCLKMLNDCRRARGAHIFGRA